MIKIGQVSAVHTATKTIDVYLPDEDAVIVDVQLLEPFGVDIRMPTPPQQVLVAFLNQDEAYALGMVNES